ncbi:MAG: amidohydrolase family protein [Anaerolineales bacterium]
MSEYPIHNCHIHTFTSKHVPRYFVSIQLGLFLGRIVSALLHWNWFASLLIRFAERFNPRLNDALERQGRFLKTSNKATQMEVFKNIEKQYPNDTLFVVLPMDMQFIGAGEPLESWEEQHQKLLDLAYRSPFKGRIIPFMAVDPRRDGIVKFADQNLGEEKFRGIKIYPNLGYSPEDKVLKKVYAICQERGYPVLAHCSPGGIWARGMSEKDRRRFAHPKNYIPILREFPELRLCLGHFGGAQEWVRHLKSRRRSSGPYRTWVRWISDMITSGEYPNLYTDVSYTVFVPRVKGLYIDLIDYLKVMLSNEKLRSHVLFGSDYYMVEREEMSEKEASILLRSRLGEELFTQIVYHNPRKYLFNIFPSTP